MLTGVQVLRLPQHRIYWTQPTKDPKEHLHDIIKRLAPKAFRRPVTDKEIESFVLQNRITPRTNWMYKMVRALRGPCSVRRSSSFTRPPGPLDDHALASRLSYFLWKTLPDDELISLANEKKLTQPKVLTMQVDRMLDDPRSNRFINDFLDGWLHLSDIDATTPDPTLYPEYDNELRQAMLAETRLHLRELLAKNLPARNFIKSDFTFVNRRLAHHYGMANISGERMRRVALPADSVRGGLMTQASILKVTANGTFTSPVKRGHWVLNSLLGTPPNRHRPPSALEPDTRGVATIRETLAKRNEPIAPAAINTSIHLIALEADPIGGFCQRYRTTDKGDWPIERHLAAHHMGRPLYRWGLDVDSSGLTAGGEEFRGIRRFRDLLLTQEGPRRATLCPNQSPMPPEQGTVC